MRPSTKLSVFIVAHNEAARLRWCIEPARQYADEVVVVVQESTDDTLALALLTEAIGFGLPLVAAPALNSAQAAHPAFERSVAALREMGVTVLYGPGIYEPGPPGTGGRPYDWELPLNALDEKVAKGGRS